MLYQKAEIKNGRFVTTESKQIDQNTLTSDCWAIQFSGLTACKACKYRDTADCGGGSTLARLRAKD